ncbi:ArsR/SmtB family transcription factor [Amphiplicatus metriothermophilus]|uniref:DNA-binding transcriptional regulator, ArsR family n=2 Tax=Amphiplicatus metriothermophilus TaxID=1519374 RepID=A0A239PTT6_9PROT|nr:metalloregulator ArsR/SmtB family transcription factor [Amphiplicatus metriothermophilus]MBB5519346.1 DNA-binding transcriptional ArsR family regulator [Amphiplicatus metriothermophilus]SNT73443.1 DNA-binding transcriptional regulator, ArsR family [Amphiplicatus metriothermophilus]
MNSRPPSEDASWDLVFQALAHESRRRMLDILKDRPGLTVGALAGAFDVSRIAVMKHLAVLEEAGLVVSQKDGRARRLYFNPMPIQLVYDRWTDQYSAYWSGQVADIKRRAEARAREQKKAEKDKRQ